ncbi:MAG: YafY family transcriptional regulator [Alphaproteobacteria bacterium]|nr:YafY family transcriptional regulator [Alphaproteobacteria bacterium]
MSRAERLLDLLQALRRRRRPVSAARLATELDVSERTIYRDITTLVGQGAAIEGEAGLGYILRPGFTLPPLMFNDEEIEALVLGLRFVALRGDAALRAAAADVLAKVTDVLPGALREKADNSGLLAAPMVPAPVADLSDLRRAIRSERRLSIAYADADGRASTRTIWPIALAFFQTKRILAAWCETRQDFRHFRTDRILSADIGDESYPRRRRVLLAEWRRHEGIPEQD